jgi:hypothetical protein
VLQDTSSSKDTIILFVRGLSNEVLHTLKVNYDRGSLRVIPVLVKYDLTGVNVLNDIAITNFSDVVSSNKGQLINNLDITNFSRVESVDVTLTGTLIENSKASQVIDAHIKRLQEKIINSDNQYEKDVLENRIQNLGMNRITIRLKEAENKIPKYVLIGEWIDEHLVNNKNKVQYMEEQNMEIMDLIDSIYIPTIDYDGNVSWGEISAITRHDPGDELYEI